MFGLFLQDVFILGHFFSSDTEDKWILMQYESFKLRFVTNDMFKDYLKVKNLMFMSIFTVYSSAK